MIAREASLTCNSAATASAPECFPAWCQLLTTEYRETATVDWVNEKVCFYQSGCPAPEALDWTQHWAALDRTLTGSTFSWYRRHIRSRSVAREVHRFFPQAGVFAECGCGTSETSCRLQPSIRQTFLAVDFARDTLSRAVTTQCMAGAIQADIRSLPFQDATLDGIWNLGVMEHYEDDDALLALREFHRALKPNGHVLLWWPPPYGLDFLLLRTIPGLFPREPGRRTPSEIVRLMTAAGFGRATISFPFHDCFTELLVHAIAGR